MMLTEGDNKQGLDKHSYMKRYSFDEFFSKHQLNVFVKDFFASDKVQQSMQVAYCRSYQCPLALFRTNIRHLHMQVASGRSSWCAVGATR